jgi:N-methylhydantoinase A/oxoprolinase/acetone carboxylase beta subunit
MVFARPDRLSRYRASNHRRRYSPQMQHEDDMGNSSGKRYRLGFDIGGTFTDFVLIDDHSGQITSYKTLTTPHDPAAAVLEGVASLLAQVKAPGHAIETAIHGTTLITNALIERKGAKTAFITTRGFRDVLEIAKEMRYDIYDLLLVLPQPLVARPLRLEVDERLNGRGEVVTPLDSAGLAPLKEILAREKVEAVAVCLLHSYRNPIHEQLIREWLQEQLPNVSVSLSSEVAPEIREYERMSTTVANAYVQPLTEQYLLQLEQQLRAMGIERPLYLMLSSGGTSTVDTASRFPVRLLESGPAAGVLAAIFYGGVVGEESLVSFDMGGTTAKMCLIKGGRPTMTSTFEVARVHRFKRGSGLPVRIPAIELIEIGAGGGSIARINELGLLKVGPGSAGADPGPACYGFGGAAPTVTDANLLLGYLNPDYFLGGRMTLDVAAAERAVASDLSGPLGVEPIVAAYGVHQVVNESMIAATRIHIAERGADPRRLMLMAFGGAGPIHAHQIARALKMRGYIIPASAGVTSALGFLTAPASFDFARSFVARLTPDLLTSLDAIYEELEAEGQAMLRDAGVAEADMVFLRQADLRHVGQGHEISLPLPFARMADVDLDSELRPYFYDFYAGIYGHAHRHLALELITCRLTASGPRPRVTLRDTGSQSLMADAAQKGERRAYFAELGGFVEVPVYDRERLSAGMSFLGPAIVEEKDSTAVIGPGAEVSVDRYANLRVTFVLDSGR